MKIKHLSRDDLVALAQRTYEKNEWSLDDIAILRACWNEFELRGGENAVMFFRPAFWGVLKFHEIGICFTQVHTRCCGLTYNSLHYGLHYCDLRTLPQAYGVFKLSRYSPRRSTSA